MPTAVTEGGAHERLRRLQPLADAALAHVHLDDLFQELLNRLHEIFAADTSAFLLLDEERGELVPRAAKGLEQEVKREIRIPLGHGFAGRVAAERRVVALDDVDRADILNPVLREKGVKSLLGAPLVAEGRVLGVVHVGMLRPCSFSDEDAELLELAAERAARAIEHARLYEAERAARERAEANAARIEQLQAIADAALAHLDLDELLDELLTRLRDVFDADTSAVLLLDEARGELVPRAAKGLEEEVERGIRIPLGRGFAGRVAAERRVVTIEDLDHADVVNPVLREKGVKSLLGAPLLGHDGVIGVIHVGTLRPRVFSADDAELLELAAERVARAIEKARAHDELVRANDLKSRFVSFAAHELRNPAATIYAISSTFQRHGGSLSEGQGRELAAALDLHSARLKRVIDQLLDLSRVEAGTVRIEPARLKIRDVLGEIVSGIAADGGADVVVAAPRGLTADVDPFALERIVGNLVANALKHGEPPVVVEASRRDGELVVAVEDSGPGVPANLVSRLFEQFERGSATASGAGLGLSIAQAYARAHGGDIAYVQGDQRGARFELTLPLG